MKTRGMRSLGLGLLAAVLAGLVPGADSRLTSSIQEPAMPPLPPVPPALYEAAREAGESGQETLDLDLTAGSAAEQERIRQAIAEVGGTVTAEDKSFVRVRVPAAAATRIPEVLPGAAIGVNQPLNLDTVPLNMQPEAPLPDDPRQQVEANLRPIGVQDFRREFGSVGNGIVVAVIDTGVDPGHPALQSTPDGRVKLIDWQDFTREGYVAVNQSVVWDTAFTATDGQRYLLPDQPASSARFGYLDEHNVLGAINQDLDRNGVKIDRFGVLLAAAATPGLYDTVYVDTNNDRSFRDEQPLQLFARGRSVGQLGSIRSGRFASRRLNFVVASMDPQGQWVRIGFDGHGHGTQVAGVLGANDPAGFTGVAPGVQVMALKAIKSTGAGDWFDIKDAILYAVRNGAQVINLSVGGLAAGAAKVFDSGASDWLNQIAQDYGVLIILAADNNGPGLSSGATLGNPSFVMAVGSYFSPEMWKRDYNWVVSHEGVWFFSGMGPRSDGSYLPSVIAPGGSMAPSPLWLEPAGYTTAVGTSIATPHVSGAAAMLMEVAEQQGYQSDWLSVKRALEMGARKLSGYGAYEQGHGLIQLRPALGHLRQINSLPNVRGRMLDGSGGLLARSYAPGATAFLLTNWDMEATRVGVFSSEPWVRPAFSSMLLPSKIRRQLPVQIAPPQGTGVHSAFLQVTQQDKYGSSLTLPVTYVRPVDLQDTAERPYTENGALDAGRYQRQFFQVKPGTSAFSVRGRVAASQSGSVSGTVQVHVFRPDGKPAFSSRIGAAGSGVTAFFQTEDPVPGVWEVVVVALPDSRGEFAQPRYTLEVSSRPDAVGDGPLQFNVPAGGELKYPLKISNPYAAFTGKVEALGLTRAESDMQRTMSVPWRIEQRLQSTVETFTLNEFTSELQVAISNPVPGDVDLTLHLYRLDTVRGWELRGQSATPGTSNEVIQASYLPAGTYKVMVTGSSNTALTFQYRRLVGSDNLHLAVEDTERRRERGDMWTPVLTIRAPQQPGRYVGYVLLRDTEQKKILGWYPVEVSVGQPAMRVQSTVAQLTAGKPGTVTLELRDSSTGRPVDDANVTVNGLRFVSRNGQVSVPVTPAGSTQVIEVEVNSSAYQFLRERFTLPVKNNWGNYPLGVDKSEENTTWWRKVTGQLR